MRSIARLINAAIEASDDAKKLARIKNEVLKLTQRFPLYPQLSEK
jgi:glycine/serine hydroxymethyltransferase